MRRLGTRGVALALALALGGCGDDDGAEADAGDVADGAVEDAGTVDDGGEGTDGGPPIDAGRDAGSSGGSSPPVIRSASWTHGTPCGNRDRQLTVETVVEDPDTAPGALVFSGMVSGCTGAIDGATVTVVCRGTSSTIGFVRVEDEGGRFDEQAFNVAYCVDGSQTF